MARLTSEAAGSKARATSEATGSKARVTSEATGSKAKGTERQSCILLSKEKESQQRMWSRLGKRGTDPIRGTHQDCPSHSPNPPTSLQSGRGGRENENHNKRRKVAAASVPAAELQLVPVHGFSAPSASSSSPLSVWTEDDVNLDDPPICIICDEGGNLIYCDGPCHRYFHPTKLSGIHTSCNSLGMTEAEVQSVDKFYCPNCKHCQQQCFICGELGSSVTTSKGPPEVQCCDIWFCKRFFHVDCAAKLLSGSKYWRVLADAINNGVEKLFCPRHCCSVCGDGELEKPGWMVQCRRCPKAWHRYCLESLQSEQSPVIWDQHDRAFIYCRDHKILPEFQAPRRDHLRFPASDSKSRRLVGGIRFPADRVIRNLGN